MKNTFLFTLLILPFLAFSQEDEKVLLRWKLEPGEKLAYASIVETAEINPFNISRQEFSEEISGAPDVLSKFIDNLRQIGEDNLEKMAVATELSGISDTEMKFLMFQVRGIEKSNSFEALKKEVNPDYIIQASLSTSGEISTEINPYQAKNIARLLFYLPEEEVSIGECWEFRGNFVNASPGVKIDTLFTIDKVCLVDIEMEGAERIALIQYDISVGYRVNSSYINPNSEDEYTIVEVSYLAEGKFSIDTGRWISLDALEAASVQGNAGISGGAKSSIIVLEP